MYYRTESLVGIPRRFRSTHCLHLEQCKTYNESHTREEYFLSHSLSTSWTVQNLRWVTYHRRVFSESLVVYISNSAKLTMSHTTESHSLSPSWTAQNLQWVTYQRRIFFESLPVSILNTEKLSESHTRDEYFLSYPLYLEQRKTYNESHTREEYFLSHCPQT